MFMFNPRNRVNRTIVSLLIGALCITGMFNPLFAAVSPLNQSAASAAAQSNVSNNSSIAGQLIVYGSVSVNDRQVLTGSSIFTNSLIKVACNQGSSAIVRLGRGGLIEVKPGTSFMLKFNNGMITGELREGSLKVKTMPGMGVAIDTPEGRVATDGQNAAFLPIAARKTSNCVNGTIVATDGTTQSGAATAGAAGAGGSSSLSAAALAALIFGVGVAGAITIVALTQSGYQVSPVTP
jgi:hypothetical protein